MKLISELDFRRLAKDAGLKPRQAELFARGLDGKHSQTVDLARQPYTQLQTEFESALMTVILANPELVFSDEEDALRPPFLYRTPKLGTPVNNPAHPRAAVIQSMVTASTPTAALVCNFEGLETIEGMEHLKNDDTRERLARILSNDTRIIDPFSSNAPSEATGHTFMVTRPFGGLSPLQFEASQMPNFSNQEPGRLVFGEEALAAYERGIIRHHVNRTQGRTSDFIKRAIFG